MALIITGVENALRGVLKVGRGAFGLASGVGDVVGATAGLGESGFKQVQNVLAGGKSPGKSPKRECGALTKRQKPCKKRAMKGKKKCCIHN